MAFCAVAWMSVVPGVNDIWIWERLPMNRMPIGAGGGVAFCLAIDAIALPPFPILTSCCPSCARLAIPSIALFLPSCAYSSVRLNTLFMSTSARASVVSSESCGLVVDISKMAAGCCWDSVALGCSISWVGFVIWRPRTPCVV